MHNKENGNTTWTNTFEANMVFTGVFNFITLKQPQHMPWATQSPFFISS